MSNDALLTDLEVADLEEIIRLLKEAYDHYFEHSDGYCKSSEGNVAVDFGNYFERRGGQRERAVTVYSYVLGPSRSHYFDSTREALKSVRMWHKEEMATDHEANEREMWAGVNLGPEESDEENN